jgi:hypothetical protein
MRTGTGGSNIAAALGRGLIAGLAGTVAITISQMVEMKLRHRPPSAAPADAAGKVLGVKPTGEAEKQRFSNLVHFAYGTAWGVFRGLLDLAGIRGAEATAIHAAAVQSTAMVMLPALKVAPPVSQWGAEEIGIESLHHVVYAAAAGATYDFLRPRETGGPFGGRGGRNRHTVTSSASARGETGIWHQKKPAHTIADESRERALGWVYTE